MPQPRSQRLAGNGARGQTWLSGAAECNDCILMVRDSGLGIPKARREKVLEPFFTTDSTGQETGLGLAVCQLSIAGAGEDLPTHCLGRDEPQVDLQLNNRGSRLRQLLDEMCPRAGVPE